MRVSAGSPSGLARTTALVALVGGLTGCGGCHRDKPHGQGGSLPPLAFSGATMQLPVAGHGDAVVAVPAGVTRAMPVVVAVLGIGDTPEEQCEAWRDIVGTRAFVLCPRGAKHYVLPEEEDAGAAAPPALPNQAVPSAVPAPSAAPAQTTEAPAENEPPPAPKLSPPKVLNALQVGKPVEAKPEATKPEAKQVGFYPVDVPTLDKEVLADLAALKAKFTTYVAEKNLVYAGFSRGAFLGPGIITRHPDVFGRAVLIEGGQSEWTPQLAASFAKTGGKRVLFACGQASCLDESNPAANLLRTQKLETKVVIGNGEGHGYKKQVKEELKKSFEWVIEGDPAWD